MQKTKRLFHCLPVQKPNHLSTNIEIITFSFVFDIFRSLIRKMFSMKRESFTCPGHSAAWEGERGDSRHARTQAARE